MRRIITFPDVQADFIFALRKTLTELGVTDIRVASKRLNDDQTSSIYKEVIISSAPGLIRDRVFLEKEFTIYVFVENSNENLAAEEMTNLELKLLTALGFVKQNSETIKIVENISSTPFEDTGITRITSFLCTVTSTALTIEEQ